MIEPQGKSGGGGVMRIGHYLVVTAVAIVAVVVAFAIFSTVVGIVFEIVKIAVVVAVIAAAFWLVTRIARRGR
ncbi:MAG: hypothetical protein ACLPQS_00270 [Acidimicrobiales bacterium]